MKSDIETIDDIKLMVDTFYQRVRENELLGPVFNERINGRWPEHLNKMYQFWQTILLGQHTYHGAPFPPHATMVLSTLHFETWVRIFVSTIDDLFEGEIASEAKHRGTLMAAIFNSKTEYLINNKG